MSRYWTFRHVQGCGRVALCATPTVTEGHPAEQPTTIAAAVVAGTRLMMLRT